MRLVVLSLLASISFAMALPAAHAQTAPAASAAWKYKTKRLSAKEVDALLAQPDKLLVLDVRRPDELIKYGSFPAYLSVQNGELEKHLAYLPKDRAILTVSNHAQRAGRAGDLLASKGFIVAGATGSEDYEQEGGKSVVHIQPPVARQVQSNQVLEERTKGSSISSLTPGAAMVALSGRCRSRFASLGLHEDMRVPTT